MKITANSYEELRAMYIARSILADHLGVKSRKSEAEMIREIKECFDKGREHEDVQKLIEDLTEYRESLKVAGVKDWQVSFSIKKID